MVAIRKIISPIVVLGGVAYAASDWLKGSTEEKFKTLAEKYELPESPPAPLIMNP